MHNMYDVNKKLRVGKAYSLIQRLLGGFCSVVFLVCWIALTISLFEGKGNLIVVIIFFLLIGASRIHYNKGIALKNLIKNYETYSLRLSGRLFVTLDELAVIVEQDPVLVQKNIEEMIKKGYINKIEAPDGKRIVYIQNTGIELIEDAPNNVQNCVAVKCEACGGVSEIPAGESGICEYCGSNIHS